MSGTSLDGVDLACCEFTRENEHWEYRITAADTIPYPPAWKKSLETVNASSAYELALLHKDYGHYLGTLANSYLAKTGFSASLIASHGHTIFHRPEERLTYQLGDGAALAAVSGLPVVCDFRTTDVALGGQGAPLVPAGDKLLFGDFDYCLNLGGFSNISFDKGNSRIAHDVSPCNMALNLLAGQLGHDYDNEGRLAAQGRLVTPLFDRLNQLTFYALPAPKSLGREWFEKEFLPLLQDKTIRAEDLLRTVTEHIAFQVFRAVQPDPQGKMLITGGGAHNLLLVNCIKEKTKLEIIVPDDSIVDFKEALVFAFLGALRFTGQVNVLSSVTGARYDHCAGALYL